jgi:hypothetical protein
MKLIKFAVMLCILCSSTAFASTWCGYSEFIKGKDNAEAQKQIVNMRAGKCEGQPGTSGIATNVTVKSVDGSRTCLVENTSIAANLLQIGTPAYPALQISDPEAIRTNPATKDLYVKIFGCK